MKRPRADGLRAALLANGKVMVVGGDYIDTTTRSTKAPSSQAYNPVYDGWSSIAKLVPPPPRHVILYLITPGNLASAAPVCLTDFQSLSLGCITEITHL